MLELCTGAHAVASVCAQARILMPASSPKGKRLQIEQGLGEGALKALTVDFPLLMIFLLVFCLLGILPVPDICTLYIVVSLLLCVCYTLCSVKR